MEAIQARLIPHLGYFLSYISLPVFWGRWYNGFMRCGWSSYLDIAILQPGLTPGEVLGHIARLSYIHPCTFCIHPQFLEQVKPLCGEQRIGVCVEVGYPHGEQLPECKADEVQRILAKGVDEIQLYSNLAYVRARDWEALKHELRTVSALTRPAGVPLKVYVEACTLSDMELCEAIETCIEANADMFLAGTCGAPECMARDRSDFMLRYAAQRIQIKTLGGVDHLEDAEQNITRGIARLGLTYIDAERLFEHAISI